MGRAEEGEGGVRAVERAIDILFSFTQNQPVRDMPGLQAQTGLSRPTLYRLLHTLESKGLVYSFGSPKRFQLGYRFGMLSNTWSQNPALVAIAGERLEQLWRQTQETVALMMPVSPTHRMCVFELKSPQAISFSRGTGYTEPLHRGASGKVILAHLSAEQQQAALGSVPAESRTRISRELESVRIKHFLVTHGEVIPGTVAIASPVLAGSGEVLAAICVFGTELRLQGATLRACELAILQAARDVSQMLSSDGGVSKPV
ncbi:MAG: IclR family transcriptional regulator [Lautropia sp.]